MDLMSLNSVKSWLDKNTFHCYDYQNLHTLYKLKNNNTISLVMPTLNEEDNVGTILQTIIKELNKDYQILDEIILIDGG